MEGIGAGRSGWTEVKEKVQRKTYLQNLHDPRRDNVERRTNHVEQRDCLYAPPGPKCRRIHRSVKRPNRRGSEYMGDGMSKTSEGVGENGGGKGHSV